MRRIWAVAKQMIREGVRMKIALVFIIVLVILMPVFAFSVKGDGVTLVSRIQMFISFSLSALTLLLSLLTVFLACNALTGEIREKHIHMIVVKPIPRWQFVVGKWLGIIVLDLALLAGSGAFIYAGTWYLGYRLPARHPERFTELDLFRVHNEVFTARAGIPLQLPDMSADIENRLRQQRAEGTLTTAADADLDRLRKEIGHDLRRNYLSIEPRGGFRVYLFKDLLVDRKSDAALTIRYMSKGTVARDNIWRTVWIAGDPAEGTGVVQIRRYDPDDRFNNVEIPVDCVSDEGILRLEIHNLDPSAPMNFADPEAGIELLYHLGGFGWNLFRSLTLISFRLMLIASLGLLMSSFLSFPVACMATLLVFCVAIGAGFLSDAISFQNTTADDPLWFINRPLQALGIAFVWVVPDLTKYDPIPTIVDGRVVTLMWLILGSIQLVFTRALALAFAACIVFTRREMAQVIV